MLLINFIKNCQKAKEVSMLITTITILTIAITSIILVYFSIKLDVWFDFKYTVKPMLNTCEITLNNARDQLYKLSTTQQLTPTELAQFQTQLSQAWIAIETAKRAVRFRNITLAHKSAKIGLALVDKTIIQIDCLNLHICQSPKH